MAQGLCVCPPHCERASLPRLSASPQVTEMLQLCNEAAWRRHLLDSAAAAAEAAAATEAAAAAEAAAAFADPSIPEAPSSLSTSFSSSSLAPSRSGKGGNKGGGRKRSSPSPSAAASAAAAAPTLMAMVHDAKPLMLEYMADRLDTDDPVRVERQASLRALLSWIGRASPLHRFIV